MLCMAGIPGAQTAHAQATPPAPPPQTGGTTTLTVTTRLVVLDVVVTDNKGVPRDNLRKEDVHITENGVPVTISTFEPPSVHVPPPLHQVESTADLENYAPQSPVDIIVMDELNTKFEDMAYAR
jgi:hypothetical protein